MAIWGALLIPILAIFILLIFFQHRTKWWEVGIPLLASLLLIGGFKILAEHFGTKDLEIWGGWVQQARYYEHWNEYVHQTCYNTVCSGSGQNQVCTQVPYDCSYVADHPEHWAITDSNGAQHSITKKAYLHLVQFFGATPTFKDMHRSYHSIDGDQYFVNWPGTPATVEPVTTAHTYENRVQASRSVFSYVKLSEKEAAAKGLFEYPEVTLFGYPAVLGDCGPTTKRANERLRYHNAVLGRKKQLRIWILCTHRADPEWGQLQEAYWVGGNKNEAVLVAGPGWAHIFTWAEDKTPLIEARDFLLQQPERDLVPVADFLAERLDKGFVRKEFADFSYLTVEPPTWAVVLTYVLTLLLNVGLSFFVVQNEWHDDVRRRRYRY